MLSNSVPLVPGPNINKPRIKRPQEAAHQTVILNRENETNEETNTDDEKNILTIHKKTHQERSERNKNKKTM
jgi:hypothetical protein